MDIEDRIVVGTDANDVPASAAQLHRAGKYVGSRLVLWSIDDTRRPRGYERDDTVLEFTAREAFGVDVADLFNLQGRLQCRRDMRALDRSRRGDCWRKRAGQSTELDPPTRT